tara:strand:+ start:60 stop:230 length:171 start_codon:yes stop_codon:yes gene_type:complete
MGTENQVFVPQSIFNSFEECEDFRSIQHVALEKTKPHEQSGVKGSICVQVPKGENI